MAAWSALIPRDPDNSHSIEARFESNNLFEVLDEAWKMHRTFEKPVEVWDHRDGEPVKTALIRVEWLD